VKTNNPFLPGISTKLDGRTRRGQLEEIRNKLLRLRGESLADFGILFGEVLPLGVLHRAQEHLRTRVFPEVVVFWAWISQLLESNASCARALTLVQSWYDSAGLPLPAFDTSSYCRARARLSDGFLGVVERQTMAYAENRIEGHHLWYGFRLKAIDGTSVKLLDSDANQEAYPQPSNQAPGCGYPVMGVSGVLDLATGRIEAHALGGYREHDARGLYKLCGHFGENDLLIADRAYSSYELMALLLAGGTHSVMRLHQRREGKLDWRRGRRLDPDSRVVVWTRPPAPGDCGITREQWEGLPATMEIRLVRVRGKGRDGKARTMYVATTLTDAQAHPTAEIGHLYAERWKIEVKFRDIKTTMRMEMLRTRSPEMARKSVRMMAIAYNLVKAIQMEAVAGMPVVIDEIGFKGSLDVLNEFRGQFRGAGKRPRLLRLKLRSFFERILERVLRIRPGRSEPRATKLRPKPYQYLTKPRAEFTEILHRSHYRAAA
jgi:hypothetical protein